MFTHLHTYRGPSGRDCIFHALKPQWHAHSSGQTSNTPEVHRHWFTVRFQVILDDPGAPDDEEWLVPSTSVAGCSSWCEITYWTSYFLPPSADTSLEARNEHRTAFTSAVEGATLIPQKPLTEELWDCWRQLSNQQCQLSRHWRTELYLTNTPSTYYLLRLVILG